MTHRPMSTEVSHETTWIQHHTGAPEELLKASALGAWKVSDHVCLSKVRGVRKTGWVGKKPWEQVWDRFLLSRSRAAVVAVVHI